MMTREEVAEVITYCKENGISYKGEFLQLSSGGTFIPTPSFAATPGKMSKAEVIAQH